MGNCGPKKATGAELLARGSRIANRRLREEQAAKMPTSSGQVSQRKAPAGLGRAGSDMFRKLAGLLESRGSPWTTDLKNAIVAASQTYNDFRAADKAVRDLGGQLTYRSSNGNLSVVPELKIRDSAHNRFARAIRLFDPIVPEGILTALLGLGPAGVSASPGPNNGEPPYHDDGEAIGSDGLPMSKSKDRFFDGKFQSQPGNTALIVDSEAGGIIETVLGPDLRPIR